MKKTVIVFGLISGAISSLMMAATVPFANHQSYVLGYTSIVLSFLLVFFCIAPTATTRPAAKLPSPKGSP